ncbi:hypothetical protein [Virgisporangium aliadipatigenens]|nr:hypothetical protein [Virgisporangium aliadipatigenens]
MSIRSLTAAALALLVSSVAAVPAAAHAPDAAADTVLAQTFAGTELTVALRHPERVPGPLRVDLIAHLPAAAVTIAVSVRPVTSDPVDAVTVSVERDTARTYPVELTVRGTGAHWLELRAPGEVSQLPFRVLVPRAGTAGWLATGAFAATGLLLACALAGAVTGRRALAGLLGGAGATAFVVAATVALLTATLPPAAPEGAALTGTAGPQGRPYAQARIRTEPATPAVGDEFTLRVELTDGSTGRPVDDLVPHHAALAHAVVTSLDGTAFHHVHPRRVAPGRLEVRLRAARPGPHVVTVEVERAESGGQLVSGRFEVTGDARTVAAPPLPQPLPGVPRDVVAGAPVRVEIDTGPGRIQPWLGMAGHLIVRDDAGAFLGHAHELASMNADAAGFAPPDDTVAAYGPTLRFAFTFPAPGRYLVWLQYVRDLRLVTVPYAVNVRAEPA